MTLPDTVTGARADVQLGPFDAASSRELYRRLLAEWEAAGRRIPTHLRGQRQARGMTVEALCARYLQDVEQTNAKFAHFIQHTLGVLVLFYGSLPAADFGPRALVVVRDRLRKPADDGSRRAWSRKSAAGGTLAIVRMFRWAAAEELLPASIWQSLQSIEPLKPTGDDPEPIKPVPLNVVRATQAHCTPTVSAMIELQLLTGMRPGEVCEMRAGDLERDADVWVYRPQRHKTSWRGKKRVVYLGPKAQELIAPLLRGPTDHIFRPDKSADEFRAANHARRRTPMNQGNKPRPQVDRERGRAPGEAWTVATYRRAITRAADRANLDAAGHVGPVKCEDCGKELTTWRFLQRHALALHGRRLPERPKPPRVVPHWHPHQLRHTYATEIRKQFGLEAAQILLGHSSALVTEAVYAERDESHARRIALTIG